MLRSERRFQIWDYYVTHGQLLVRSHKTVTHPKNLDLMFKGVEYVELPATLFGLELVAPEPEDFRKAEGLVPDFTIPADWLFPIVTRSRRYLVVAGAMVIEENELAFRESSLDRG